MKSLHKLFFTILFLLSPAGADLQSAFAAEEENHKTEENVKVDETYTLEEVVVTAPPITDPLRVETDPKAPRQPVPAADGGGYLKNIPGFAVTRKGGNGTDPLFRGLGGTRLDILLNGTYLQGGCGGRMDPPTAYIFPESYDKITVLKGPETVLYGGGNIAGTVLFERETQRFNRPEVRFNSSVLVGSYGRNDQMIDVTAGEANGYVRVIGTRAHADDYKDGDGNKVHSFYTRKSITGIVGWTPDANTRIEFSADGSEAQAAYADRGMDGSKFNRTAYSLRFEKENISPRIRSVDFNTYYNYIDHVMDNYSLRTVSGMAMAGNPDRRTIGGRLATELVINQNTLATVGIDYQENKHTGRSGTDYDAKPRIPDMTFKNFGIFGDVNRKISVQDRLMGGLRTDFLNVKNEKPGNIASENETTYGAFLRYEHDLSHSPVTTYFGIGHAERPADWWERNRAFLLKPEKTTQLDTGLIYQSGKLRSSLSLFYAKIDDFILLTSKGTYASNIAASTFGGEAEIAYSLSQHWTTAATLAYVHGTNDTGHKPLAQIPPLEGTLGLKYNNQKFTGGLLWRLVAAQNRVDVGSGNEIGTDIGTSAGFGILSTHAAYRPSKHITVAAGIDNIFNKTYAEYLSKAVSSSVATIGYPVTTRVNEPGRNYWVKASYAF